MSKLPPKVASENLHTERRLVTKIIPIPKDARRFRLASKTAGYPRDEEFSAFDTPEAKASTRLNNELSAAMAITLAAQNKRLIAEDYLDADGNLIEREPVDHRDGEQRVFENKRTRSL